MKIKKIVRFTKDERAHIWCRIASTFPYFYFHDATYDTLRDKKEYEIKDNKILIPYKDSINSKDTYKIDLDSTLKYLKNCKHKPIVSLT